MKGHASLGVSLECETPSPRPARFARLGFSSYGCWRQACELLARMLGAVVVCFKVVRRGVRAGRRCFGKATESHSASKKRITTQEMAKLAMSWVGCATQHRAFPRPILRRGLFHRPILRRGLCYARSREEGFVTPDPQNRALLRPIPTPGDPDPDAPIPRGSGRLGCYFVRSVCARPLTGGQAAPPPRGGLGRCPIRCAPDPLWGAGLPHPHVGGWGVVCLISLRARPLAFFSSPRRLSPEADWGSRGGGGIMRAWRYSKFRRFLRTSARSLHTLARRPPGSLAPSGRHRILWRERVVLPQGGGCAVRGPACHWARGASAFEPSVKMHPCVSQRPVPARYLLCLANAH